MDQDKRVADYFVVAGLPDNPSPLDDVYSRDASSTSMRAHTGMAPITDIAVIFRSMGETVPNGYTCIEFTPFKFPADLNHGSIRSPNVYLCYKRGYDKPPIVDIGVLYEGKDRLMADSEIVHTTPFGRPANVNNGVARTYITYRRYHDTGPCNVLVVTDVCIILANKGETPPHAFCVIGKNLNKGMLGSDVFVCYKKSMHRPKLLCFKPEILGRFPAQDYDNFPLPISVPLFCLPMGATLEAWPKKAKQQKPLFSTFVLTVSDAVQKVFGAAVTFYETFPQDKLSAEQKLELGANDNYTIYGNKSICILSHWPFFDTFEKFLHYLHTMSISGRHQLPLERYISHFMLNVPFPSPQRPRILIQLASDRISLIQPEDTPLPLSGASFRQLLRNLGPENCMMVLLFALLEQKLLVHSLRPDVLTSVAEAVAMMIFPFHWQCPYIPLCPLALADVLNAPLPFIVGVDSRYFDIYEPPYDVTCVDLDTNTISICEEKRGINLKLFPKKAARILKNTLQGIFDRIIKAPVNANDKENIPPDEVPIDQDFKLKKKERAVELEIQEAFLRFMSTVLKGYKSYLLPITKRPTVKTTDASSLFDLQGFLKSRDRAYQRFYAHLMKTQMFTRFIEERSFVSNNDASLAFFDDCTEKVDVFSESSESRLLESDDSHQSDRTVFLTPPEPIGLAPGVEYKYKEFGKLNDHLFIQPTRPLEMTHRMKKEVAKFAPSSPLAKRTKHEMKCALKVARRQAETPMLWAKCLLSYCYSLWFIHLPSYVHSSPSKWRALNTAYEVLNRMQSLRLHPADEVCYRVLMQLCGQYSQPVLAVKLLFEMKRHGMQLNAITYGFYNKAVLESEWPSANSSASLLWNKLRNVILGVAQFKRAIRLTKVKRSLSLNSDLDLEQPSRTSSRNSHDIRNNNNADFVNDLIKVDDPIIKDDRSSTGGQSDVGYCSMNLEDTKKSTSSIASQSCQPIGNQVHVNSSTPRPKARHSNVNQIARFADFRASDEFRSKVGSIVRKSGNSCAALSSIASSAGILIASQASLHEDIVFIDDHSESPADSRRRHKSESESSTRKLYKDKAELRTRHCSGSSIRCDSPTRFLDHNEPECCNKDLNLCSEDFGCDANIICRIGAKPELLSVDGADDEPELKVKRPRSPNIPIKNKRSSVDVDKDLSEQSFSSPGKDSWFNLDILGNLPRMTSSLSSSFGFNGNSTASALSSWSMALANKSAKVTRSATFCEDNAVQENRNKLLRSSTLPVSESQEQLADEADETDSNISNSWLTPIKNNFKRTESFRIKEGLSNLKSRASVAASSMASKITEIKQSMSASNTPIKDGMSKPTFDSDRLGIRCRNIMDEDSISGCSGDRVRLSVDYTHLSSRNPSMCSVNSEEVEECPPTRASYDSSFHHIESAPLMSSFYQQRIGVDPQPAENASVAMEIMMTTCSKCHICHSLLYDEEITAGWSADDSNLNTQCQFCRSRVVPLLTVNITDYRWSAKEDEEEEPSDKVNANSDDFLLFDNEQSASESSNNSSTLNSPVKHLQNPISADLLLKQSAKLEENKCYDHAQVYEPISVPFLSPLVLRKEIENVLDLEGDLCLIKAHFVDEHPIIYWNLMWFFWRIGMPTHLAGLSLHCSYVKKGRQMPAEWSDAQSHNVFVNCRWDNPALNHEMGPLMYNLWTDNNEQSSLVEALVTEHQIISKTLLEQMLASIQCNDLCVPIKLLMNERQKKNKQTRSHGMYRDLLFLAYVALGRDNIDTVAFDKEYRRAFDSLNRKHLGILKKNDRPPTLGSIFCRRYFRDLLLKVE